LHLLNAFDREGDDIVVIEILQLFVLTLLAFCMFFGLGFIINMLMKTTWFPIYGYIVFVCVLVYWSWGSASFFDNLKGYTVADVLPLISGLAGAILSGYMIKLLRDKGYKMY
jgi:ABC-type transport system involved in multi-copper enzyme maturation permease subunit